MTLWPNFGGLGIQILRKLVPDLYFDDFLSFRTEKVQKTTKNHPWPNFPHDGLETQISEKLVPVWFFIVFDEF